MYAQSFEKAFKNMRLSGETVLFKPADSPAKNWLRPFLAPLTPVFREVVAMSFFVNLLALAIPVFTMQVYNRVVNNNGISTLQGLVVGMFLVLVFDYILRQSRARILQTVALRVDVELGRRLFRKLMRLPLQNLESQPSAYWTALFRDVDVVRNTLSGSTALLVADLPFAILFLVLIFVIAAPVAWVLLVMLPVFMFIAWRSANIMGDASGQERQSTQSRDSLIGEMIAGRTTIKALALDRSMEPVWEEKHAQNIENAIMRGSKTDSFSNLGASLSLITSLLLTTVGALAIIDQNLTVGALIATNMLSGRIMGPLNQLVGTWRVYSGFVQSSDRLGTVFEASSEREESEVTLKKPKGKLSIENVMFAYAEGAAPVVSGISLEIEPGGVHALVGRNGSGKTTLLKIIQGLYQPQKGRVLLDGADMAQFTRAELADWLGYVPQESVLFAGTVRDNITSRQPNATDEEIIKAATEAGVHHFIIDLPDGYATEIGEAGSRLSGGQRQRIAIARALVGDPPVVLLDEPSSSLDRHAETELKQTLVDIAKTRTVIMVSHSPTLLSACDFLYALDRGKLALAGPAREILPRLFGGKAPPPDDGPGKPGPGKPGPGKPGPGKGPGGGAPKPGVTSPAIPAAIPHPQPTPAQPMAVQAAVAAQAKALIQTTASAQPKMAAALRGAKPLAPGQAKPINAPIMAKAPAQQQPNTPLPKAPQPKANAQLRGTEKLSRIPAVRPTPPSPAAASRGAAPVMPSAAIPALRSVPNTAQNLPRVDASKNASPSTPTPHKAINVAATLRPANAPVPQSRDGGNGGRATPQGRGVGARTRSTPSVRHPKSAE